MSDILVSFSELKQYQTCPRSWQLGYLERWRGPETPGAATLGKLIHAALEELYRPEATPSERLGQAWTVLETSEDPRRDDAVRIFDAYVEWAREEDRKLNWEPVAVEWKFEVPLPLKGYSLKGSVDLIVRNRVSGGIIIVDHKSSAMKYPTEDELAFWPQGLDYAYAWNLLNPDDPCTGLVWNGINTKPLPVRETTKYEAFRRVWASADRSLIARCVADQAEEARNAYENYSDLGAYAKLPVPRAPIRPSKRTCNFCSFKLVCEKDRRWPLTDAEWSDSLLAEGLEPNAPRNN